LDPFDELHTLDSTVAEIINIFNYQQFNLDRMYYLFYSFDTAQSNNTHASIE